MSSQSIYFQKFPQGGMPPDPSSISMLCMLIVLCKIATHNQMLHFICVTMPDLETPLENATYAWT